jgi:hypothetical protein
MYVCRVLQGNKEAILLSTLLTLSFIRQKLSETSDSDKATGSSAENCRGDYRKYVEDLE